ncbi:hypothetical protein [Aureliella helgolandensis]|uniref:Uncharacterized protein n=1 Tax=Aureliella helgolandensis TaxID=2527968 RepID=A0A518G0V7_9BACT|nr:hypothetical protein [Aureliella helgolandensis]QDV22238.1 hypothetical protein Q31a_05220 [Aureliella helgolandensis]
MTESANTTMHRSGRSAALGVRDFFGGHSVMVAVIAEMENSRGVGKRWNAVRSLR